MTDTKRPPEDDKVHGYPAGHWDNDSSSDDEAPERRYSEDVQQRMKQKLKDDQALIEKLRRERGAKAG